MTTPRLWLTSTCAAGNVDNITEMVEPVLPWLDGIIWALNDCPADDPGARYLESVKGDGKVIHRPWAVGRHNVSMNETLYTGLIAEDDYMLYADALERPMSPFVSRIKAEIGPMMEAADLDVLFYYGKPFLIRYRETLEYRGSPHWHLEGWNGRAIEWNKIEPDEKQVRFNARPLKRTDPFQWVTHYLKYLLYPAGTNHALLGLDTHGDPNVLFAPREANRLEFRREMVRRGFPTTVEGFLLMCRAAGQPDDELKCWLGSDKVFSDAYHHLVRGRTDVVHSHDPKDALLIL